MSDGDIDFSKYSAEQLVGILDRIDRQAYPLNFQNAFAALSKLRAEASAAIPPLPPPLAGTRRFAVHFGSSQPGVAQYVINDQGLAGRGHLDVGESWVTFAELRNGTVYRERTFAMAEIANTEWSQDQNRVIARTAIDERHVAVWLESPDEAAALKNLLPATVTPQFAEQRRLEADFPERLQALAPRALVVPALIAVNVLLFLIMAAAGAGVFESDAQVHVRFGSNYGALTWTGEPWRLLTSAFLHFGVIHLGFNMYALYNGGLLAEKLYGSARFLAIYLLAALSGGVLSGWWDSSRNSAGASGAVFGVYGALLVFFALRRADIPARLLKSAGKGALFLCGYSLVIGATNPLIDNACHVGGLLGGAAAGFLLARPFRVEARTESQPARLALVAVVICAALAMFSMSLWMPGGGRHLEVLARRDIQEFAKKEQRLIDRFVEIAKAVETSGARLAARKIQIEAVQPWRGATKPLLAIDAGRISDQKFARTVRVLQAYMKDRERAMVMTVESFDGSQARTTEELESAWQRVQNSIDELSKLQ